MGFKVTDWILRGREETHRVKTAWTEAVVGVTRLTAKGHSRLLANTGRYRKSWNSFFSNPSEGRALPTL